MRERLENLIGLIRVEIIHGIRGVEVPCWCGHVNFSDNAVRECICPECGRTTRHYLEGCWLVRAWRWITGERERMNA